MKIKNLTRRWALKGAMSLVGGSACGLAGEAMAKVPWAEGFATVPGGKIYWRKFGAGGKTPLLTLHGGPGSSHNYLLPLRALADERPVIFYDQLGCGRADAPED